MNIAVFGLGYVGAVTGICLAARGHGVVGVDLDSHKVGCLQSGRSPIVERDLGPLVERAVTEGRLRATTDPAQAVLGSDVSLVCVGTPSRAGGALDLSFVERVIDQIGDILRRGNGGLHSIVLRSTVLPGTTEEAVLPRLVKQGLERGRDFGLAYNPEFMREGSAVRDFHNPPKTVIGELDGVSADRVEDIYAGLDVPVFRVPPRVAESVKYADNAFHALKVTFANEIGRLAKAHGIAGSEVMDILTSDGQLNISPAYLRPGFAFGGSCLPKDLRALNHRARELSVPSPLLDAIIPSNNIHLEQALELIEELDVERLSVLGLSFKAGTDDLRESPVVRLLDQLDQRGYDFRIFDPRVDHSRLVGKNRSYVERRLPHLAERLV